MHLFIILVFILVFSWGCSFILFLFGCVGVSLGVVSLIILFIIGFRVRSLSLVRSLTLGWRRCIGWVGRCRSLWCCGWCCRCPGSFNLTLSNRLFTALLISFVSQFARSLNTKEFSQQSKLKFIEADLKPTHKSYPNNSHIPLSTIEFEDDNESFSQISITVCYLHEVQYWLIDSLCS